jgi:predicted esterase
VLHFGPAPAAARVTTIAVHGRGASADDILGLTREIGVAAGVRDLAFLAPQAAGHTWYPLSFLSPLERNEPWLTSALGTLERLVSTLESQGIPSQRIGLLGFSQGACLSLEFAARHPRHYAAVIAFSGGLIGPPGTPRTYTGSLAGTPVFLGCSDVDPHIPVDRVRESAAVLKEMHASVDTRIYPGMGHTINQDELTVARALLGGKSSG